MTDETNPNEWNEKEIALQDVVISNSWALQAILQYLDDLNPGARDQIWRHYLKMKEMSEAARGGAMTPGDDFDEDFDDDDDDSPDGGESVIH
ncbi:MAG: hypothetical protein GC154_11545 [bacterium]|nr:hypothetical protein [bacterium]